MTDVGPNAEFISCWRDILSPKFERFRRVAIEGFGRHSASVIDELGTPGARILDVGCGWGDTTVQLGKRVGADGAVLGIDCVDSFLDYGRGLAAEAGLAQVCFVEGDAQTHRFEPGWDAVFARFGTMFFASPVHALRNLGRASRPGARLAMIVWRRIEENPWLGLAKQIALAHLPRVEAPSATCGPGPFSMASPDVVGPMLEAAGWVEPSWRAIDVPIPLGPVDDAIALSTMLGPAGEIVREAGELGEARRPVILDELRAELSRHLVGDDVVLGSASWCISARWPT